jgi:hypothetical protein
LLFRLFNERSIVQQNNCSSNSKLTNILLGSHYHQCFKTKKNFVNFVKINTDDIDDYDTTDLERIVQGIGYNMYACPQNIETAKSDYIILVEMLIRKGIIFKDFQDLKPNRNYPD